MFLCLHEMGFKNCNYIAEIIGECKMRRYSPWNILSLISFAILNFLCFHQVEIKENARKSLIKTYKTYKKNLILTNLWFPINIRLMK